MFELQCYSDVYNYCWVGELQEICQGRETRGGHQWDREKKTENAFVCRLGWLTWLENNNRPPFSLTSPLLWFIGYNIIDSHWRWIWNMCLACCYCLCLHSTFTARGVLFLVYSLPCCKSLLLFQLPPVLFFLPHSSHREVKKGGTALSWGGWGSCRLWRSAWCRKVPAHVSLLTPFRERGLCSLPVVFLPPWWAGISTHRQ